MKSSRADYSDKFICSQCGETIFVFGISEGSQPGPCAICRALTGWMSGFGDRRKWPDTIKFSPELNAAIALHHSDFRNGPTLHCIYLDADGRSQRTVA
jgi:hypothetical protein